MWKFTTLISAPGLERFICKQHRARRYLYQLSYRGERLDQYRQLEMGHVPQKSTRSLSESTQFHSCIETYLLNKFSEESYHYHCFRITLPRGEQCQTSWDAEIHNSEISEAVSWIQIQFLVWSTSESLHIFYEVVFNLTTLRLTITAISNADLSSALTPFTTFGLMSAASWGTKENKSKNLAKGQCPICKMLPVVVAFPALLLAICCPAKSAATGLSEHTSLLV